MDTKHVHKRPDSAKGLFKQPFGPSKRFLKRTISSRCLAKPLKILCPWNILRTQVGGYRCHHLYIEQGESARLQVLNKMEQGDFGGIADAMKHGFAGKQSAAADAIDATDKLLILPTFHTMGVALPVQFGISGDKVATDPGFFPAGRRRGAPFHHAGESSIHG